MRARKLTDEQIEKIRAAIAARKNLPTHAELAKTYGVSKSLVDQIAAGLCYKVPRGTTTKIHDAMVELGLTTPYKDSNANSV